MTNSERMLGTLNFEKMNEGGAVAETFFPWTITVDKWISEGLNSKFNSAYLYPAGGGEVHRNYFNDLMTEPVYEYEQFLGFDGVKRMSFRIPFNGMGLKIHDADTWKILKEKALTEMQKYCTGDNMRLVYGKYKSGHEKGDFSIRFRASGFFWTPRELLGIEEHLIAFYDKPELIHEINQFVLDTYIQYFDKIFDIIKPETILFEEDLSGKTGPMISPEMFDEFVGAYYKKLIPFIKRKGIKNIFVDTDGDFSKLIPNFILAGVDGFLPMDVNAGMDIVQVRKEYPTLKFIGAFNKLAISESKDAIDREFERLLPVIRQGGYVPGADHQIAPSASYENYKYYISRLKVMMKQSGAQNNNI